ncbi:hypothetical protein [Streptomyces sp. NPDC001678]|uniref:hypothetical protein n=1 Tax=Streptomyces sp. NPDC001678 TaxID=3364599 RepID=UPI0036CBD574
MDLYVDSDTKGWTELRVHGVSGTPPESSLEHPLVECVAGDKEAGFYRRQWENETTAHDTKEFRREAYSWGGLTSGDGQRALWLLLLPFMFVNMAYYTDPGHTVQEMRKPDWTVGFRGWVQRVLAFSLTATYVLAAVSASVDLIGWQCGNAAVPHSTGKQCMGGTGWLQWLQYSWLNATGRHLTVAALVPVALIALLWYLGNKTWEVAEVQRVPQSSGDPRNETPLEDRKLWNGREPVRRLRALHVAGAFALTAVFLLAPLLKGPERGPGALTDSANWTWGVHFFRTLPLVLALATVAFVVVMVLRSRTAERPRPRTDDPAGRRERDAYRLLPWAGAGLVLGGGVAASWTSGNVDSPAGQLPWEVAWIHWLLVVQLVLLAFLLFSQIRRHRDARASSPLPELPRPAWHGLALTGAAFLGWGMAQSLAAGLMLRTAEILGTPVAPSSRRTQQTGEQISMLVPDAYFWGGAGFTLLIVFAGVLLLCSWRRICRACRGFMEMVHEEYGGEESGSKECGGEETRSDPRRLRQIARSWARAQSVEGAGQRALGVFLSLAAVVTVAGVFLFWRPGPRLVTGHPTLTLVSNLALSAGFLGLLWAGRQAYRNPLFRRTVGIVWDIGTFWPRATHPLAPPCYAERTVPDLLVRLDFLTGPKEAPPADRGFVIVSCHSQGTVVGAALVLQSAAKAGTRIRLLTYGCPLTTLFVRFFPAYFDGESLERLGGLLTPEGPPADPHRWCWRNLYRLSDPIGGWVLEPPPKDPGGKLPIDQRLLDPSHFGRRKGNPCYPATLGHSHYFADPAFDETVQAFREGTIPQGASDLPHP